MQETRRNVCALDCPDACAMLVRVENGRATKLMGDPQHPVTRGFLCAKVTQYLEREYHPDRLLYPQRRVGAKGEGRFERVSWDDAIGEIAERLRSVANEFGSEAVLPYSYAGTMGLLNGSGMDRRFFHRLGASRLDRTICASTGSAALNLTLGQRTGTEPEQFAHARCIIAWGANVLATNVHLWPFIVEARRAGAKFYVIDPLPAKTARLADVHLAINPGSDAALALGMMHVIFRDRLEDRQYLQLYCQDWEAVAGKAREYTPDRVASWTGIPAEQIETLAHDYATIRPSVIRMNYGIQRSERGGMSAHAVSLLPAIVGSWKEVGGGLQLSTSGGFPLNRTALERPDLQAVSPLGREARLLNMSELGKILTDEGAGGRLDPPVKALVVYNSNPAAIAPNQNRVRAGLARNDLFTVVLEQFQTDTAQFADFLLPSTTFLEHTDLYTAYGHYYLQLARPAIEAPGECKANVEVFRDLAKAMGFDDSCFADSDDEMIRQTLNSDHPYLRGISLERLEAEGSVRLAISPPGSPFLPHAEGAFTTPSGRCEFHPERLDYVPPSESRHGDFAHKARYPLELISAKVEKGMNSTFGHRDEFHQECGVVTMNPDDAQARGIENGQTVRVFNQRGSLELAARVDASIRPGLVSIPSVRWARSAKDGNGVNVLTSDALNDLGGGPVFFSCLVQVES
ncbi:MAG: molybdopterin-dependent oxidoreductase [Bryobacterales bacterium]|nr:molybdopterin-dependent oxidoreductase [Bryobacterales bacterium]